MPKLPNVTLRHVGMYVIDMDRMVGFYEGVLGFTVADRGPFRDGEIAFMTRDPDEHHEIVLCGPPMISWSPPGWRRSTPWIMAMRCRSISGTRRTTALRCIFRHPGMLPSPTALCWIFPGPMKRSLRPMRRNAGPIQRFSRSRTGRRILFVAQARALYSLIESI